MPSNPDADNAFEYAKCKQSCSTSGLRKPALLPRTQVGRRRGDISVVAFVGIRIAVVVVGLIVVIVVVVLRLTSPLVGAQSEQLALATARGVVDANISPAAGVKQWLARKFPPAHL